MFSQKSVSHNPRPQDIISVSKSESTRSPTRGQVPRCFLCNRPSHLARNCLSRPTAAMEFQTHGEAFKGSQEDAAACQPRGSTFTSSMGIPCKMHKRNFCPECLDLPATTHHHQAASILAVCQNCGTHLPVIADACHATDKTERMPVASVVPLVSVRSVSVRPPRVR